MEKTLMNFIKRFVQIKAHLYQNLDIHVLGATLIWKKIKC